jgi:hypothetical protein
MLRSANEILGYRLEAIDAELGRVKDLYFDDRAWTVRYVVVDTGTWLPKRKVLIAPQALGEPDWAGQSIPVSLRKQQIEEGPGIESDKPVSRQHEEKLVGYYNWPMYWAPVGVPATGMIPPRVIPRQQPSARGEPAAEPRGDPSLRSVKEVLGYHIDALDGEIGHVDDFIAETDDWALRYMVIDTRNWLPGRKVLISPAWIDRISWPKRQVRVCHNRQAVKNAPAFDPKTPVNREYEVRLYDYYGVPKYWERGNR